MCQFRILESPLSKAKASVTEFTAVLPAAGWRIATILDV